MPDTPLRTDQCDWLIAVAALTLLPHASHLPAGLSGICLLLLMWRGVIAHGRGTMPGRWMLLILAAVLIGFVALEFRQVFGKEPGIALLAGLMSLKLLETDRVRDGRAVVLLSFFMQLGQFLYRQDMLIAILAMSGSVASIAALMALQGAALDIRQRLRKAALLVLQGVPLMLVLFVLFPRVQGPLWGLPADAYNRSSGLSDSMAPGDMARVSQSAEIAFRARFEGVPPSPAERYWRGPVLTRFDGRVWRQIRTVTTDMPAYQPEGRAYAYTLTLEPHNQRWLLALDFPGAAPGVRYTRDFQLLAREAVTTRQRMDLVAYPASPVGLDESPSQLRLALALPPSGNPRTRALGEALKARAADPSSIPDLAIAHFRQSGLAYTLAPPPLGQDDVDSFLFDTRQGFCEHFAAAFVVTLRAAGVPARVVTGYQGGELNPIDGSLVVRQSDAHAWAEVWQAGRGWIRYDPTAASAPRRIDGGLAGALPDASGVPLLARADLAWLRAVRDRVDALNNSWNQWVLGYNPARQQELLSSLGLGKNGLAELTALMAAASAVVTAGLMAWALRRRRAEDAVDKAWQRFCRSMAAAGLERLPWEGPLDFGRRIIQARPDLTLQVEAIVNDYARLRYAPPPGDDALLQRFQNSIKNFHAR